MLSALLLLAVPAAALPSRLDARAVSAASWTNRGCVQDGAARLLPTQLPDSNANTPDICVNACAAKGFRYAGVECESAAIAKLTADGRQCHCGNSLNPALGGKSSACTSPCAGNAGLKCGGAWAMNLYENPSAAGPKPVGCYADSASRVLPTRGANTNRVATCIADCKGRGQAYAGLENGSECWCGGSLPATTAPAAKCSVNCADGPCGGFWALSVYATGATAGPSTPVSSNAAAAAVVGAPNPAGGGGAKAVYAHFMVGNTYSYTGGDWTSNINAAKAAGLDGFALNLGTEDWQRARTKDAYTAAAAAGFKLFLSLDLNALPCASAADATTLAGYVAANARSPAQATRGGKVLVSTFAGQQCTFGQGSLDAGWAFFRTRVAAAGVNMFFVPAPFVDANSIGKRAWLDGAFNWNGAWPATGADLTTASDNTYLNSLGSKTYMAAVSPFFFTYYGPPPKQPGWNKNWLYRSDNWLLATRFEQLLSLRGRCDLLQLVSWNDYGESHYVGAIGKDVAFSGGWTTGFPHTALLSLVKYYAQAFRTGAYPQPQDKLWLWSRPHPRAATPTNPTNARPQHWDWTDDNLYVVVTLASPASVVINAGGNTATWNLPAGLSKLRIASAPGAIGARIVRGGKDAKSYNSNGQFSYTNTPKDYNYNYFVAEA
ncbi:hypothetical protein Q8F55_001107 [Vanrija albida]|uniref:WSC domain-containing protein n=1 Tax=Vanrija albida TaxID=181172 RepID=A0ABR3QF41_9TREE